MKTVVLFGLLAAGGWMSFWFTPDQQGQRLMKRGEFERAAESFRDPMRIGVAWFRAGEFEKAEQAFARVPGPDAHFNRGNCLIMRGKYEDAIKQYDDVLSERPDWEPAVVNRDIAVVRAKNVKQTGGDMGDQKLGADEIKFDKKDKDSGQETLIDQEQTTADSTMQAVWLRRVQTKPATFLKSKFAFQLAEQESDETDQ